MSEIEWVGSKEEAERYVLLDESPVVLFDETCDRFYVKTADGMKSYVMQGVLRYPNGFTYDAGTNPFCCKTTATTTPAA